MSQKKNYKHKRKQSNWPMIVLVAGGLLLVIAAAFAFSQPSKPKAAIEVTGAPSLRVDKEKVDLGNVKLGRTVEVTFQLTNVGDQNLRFTEVPYIEVKEGC